MLCYDFSRTFYPLGGCLCLTIAMEVSDGSWPDSAWAHWLEYFMPPNLDVRRAKPFSTVWMKDVITSMRAAAMPVTRYRSMLTAARTLSAVKKSRLLRQSMPDA